MDKVISTSLLKKAYIKYFTLVSLILLFFLLSGCGGAQSVQVSIDVQASKLLPREIAIEYLTSLTLTKDWSFTENGYYRPNFWYGITFVPYSDVVKYFVWFQEPNWAVLGFREKGGVCTLCMSAAKWPYRQGRQIPVDLRKTATALESLGIQREEW